MRHTPVITIDPVYRVVLQLLVVCNVSLNLCMQANVTSRQYVRCLNLPLTGGIQHIIQQVQVT